MTTAQVVETSVTVINSLTQDYPGDHIQLTYEITPKLKPITVRTVKLYRIERRSVMSRSHGGKISVCQQSSLTETVIGIVGRWKKEHAWATVLFPSTIIPQESHTCQFFRYFLLYLQETVCWGPEILLRWQREATTSPLHSLLLSKDLPAKSICS